MMAGDEDMPVAGDQGRQVAGDQGRQVAILAGGLGTRLRPLTEKCPKPLVEVGGRPFLEWQLLDLKRQGFRRVVLLVAYLGEMIEARFGDGAALGLRIDYSYEPEPLGTGGALRLALPKLDQAFVLLNGDSFLRAPLAAMARALDADADALAVVSTYDRREPVPVIPNLRVDGNRVLAYEKDAGLAKGFSVIDSGAYVLRRELLADAPLGKFQLEALWQGAIAGGRLRAFPVAERFYDIGDRARLQEFEEKIRDYFPNALSH
jgi:NDP-sugar pyrophosphorylase family protein